MIDVTLYSANLDNIYYWGNDEQEFLKNQEKFVKAGFKVLPWAKEDSAHYHIDYDRKAVIIDQSRLAELVTLGITLKDVEAITTKVNIAEHLSELAGKNVTLSVPSAANYNTKREVHMPGHALSMYNDLRLMEDSCTDALQVALNEGWRIIAACPQPDQRRPDYMLGRFNPKHEGDTGAKRC